jgi:hypothetical protein
MAIMKKLSLAQPKILFKRLDEMFGDNELQTILPLIFLKNIQVLSKLIISIKLLKKISRYTFTDA